MTASASALSAGTLLDGRVRYDQPRDGYRTGLEPVLLAATVPAAPGQRVLEAGTGSGAGLLCLLARLPNLVATALELDPAAASVARHNLVANGHTVAVHEGDVAAAGRLGPVDHAFANPPWFDPAGTPPGTASRRTAKHLTAEGLTPWIAGLSQAVVGRGTLSLILPAALLSPALASLDRVGFGRVTLLPFWPRAGLPAKLLVVQARRGRASAVLLPGLVLHDGSDFSAEASRVLRDGDALPLG